jgi:hypothetical protein
MTAPGQYDNLTQFQRDLQRDRARAAIAALDRHRAHVGPSEEEIDAGWAACHLNLSDTKETLRAYLRAKAAQHGGPDGSSQ